MNIVMKDSNGDLIEIPIKDANAQKRMQMENGIKSNFTNPPEAVNQALYNIFASVSGNNKRLKAFKTNLLSDEEKSKLDSNEDSNAPQVDFLELSSLESLLNDQVTFTQCANNRNNNDNNYLKKYLDLNEIEVMEEYPSVPARNDVPLPLCRLCACPNEEMLYIFGLTQIEKDIAEKINNYLPIKVENTDTFPKSICFPCLEKLDLIHNFHKTVSESEATFVKPKENILEKSSEPIRAEKRSADSEIFTSPAKKSLETEIIDPGILHSETTNHSKTINEDKFEIAENDEFYVEDNSQTNILSETVEDIQDLSNEAREVSSNTNEAIKCRVCDTKFYTLRKCYLHSVSHSSLNYYPCSLCVIDSPSPEKWREHFAEHSSSKLHESRILNFECEICKKKHVSEARLKFHLKFHEPGAKPCYCEKCDKFVTSESVLYHHYVMVHMKSREFCCDICGSVFRSQPQLDVHQRKHKNERPYECHFCSKRFLSMDCLRRHRKLHLSDKPFQCEQCGKQFDRTHSLTKHLLTHQVEARKSIICQFCNACNEVFFDVSEAEYHIQICTLSIENSAKIEEKSLDAIYRCEFCQRCYTSIQCAKDHRISHSSPSPYICTICNVTYATYNQVQAHKSAHRKSTQDHHLKETISITKFFFCEYCEKEFLHFTNMNIHRRSCAKTKNWTCRCCGSQFPNNFELSKHKRRNEFGEVWSCVNCERTFGNFCGLITHQEIHVKAQGNQKLFICSYCGKDFQQKTHLTIHIRSHTGEKPFTCDLCNKAYSIKGDRDNHRRTHTGERPFKCTKCEKAFANPARLREHTLNHSDLRPYPCHICHQAFKKANARKAHMLIHTGEKPFQCDICGLHFRRSGDLKKHKTTQHNSKPHVDKTETEAIP